MEAIAKRLILISALGIVSVVAVPVFSTGQDYAPRTQTEYELRDLREKAEATSRRLDRFDEVLPRLAVMQEQLNVLRIGQQKTEDWQDKAFKGLLALAGSFILVILNKFAASLGIGITINKRTEA